MIAFVHVAKTAGTSLKSLFQSAFGERHCDTVDLKVATPEEKRDGRVFIEKYTPDDVRNFLDLAPRTRCMGGHHLALWSNVEEVVPDVTYLLFLRDPIKRGASHFQYTLQRQDMTPYFGRKLLTWEDWIDWEVPRNHQVKMLSPHIETNEAIELLEKKRVFVGLMERFDESLLLFKRLFRPDLNIAYLRKNIAPEKSIAQEVLGNPRKVEQLEEMYDKEIPLYEYARDEIYPRYVQEYGPRLAEDLARFQQSQQKNFNHLNFWRYKLYKRFVFDPRHRRHLARQG
jgi:hypothetical protein